VTDGNQKVLAGNCGQLQYSIQSLWQRQLLGSKGLAVHSNAAGLTMHLRWLAKQHRHGQVDGLVIEMTVSETQVLLCSCLSNHGKRTTFTLTNGFKASKMLWTYRQHITLLSLVTPDFQRRQARLCTGNIAQLKIPAPLAVLDQLRQS